MKNPTAGLTREVKKYVLYIKSKHKEEKIITR